MKNSTIVTTRYCFVVILITALLLMLFSPVVMAEPVTVFPGAEGFGIYTRTAYGLAPATNPTVYKVTSLNPSISTPGTLGYALYQKGPRVIIFEVSGTIDGPAGGVYDYWINNPYFTVAGQTAPSPGITVKGINFRIRTHDGLIQHIRIRLGDQIKPGEGLTWLENRDDISIVNPTNTDTYNIVIDHCSVSWSLDENIEVWRQSGGKVYDLTISNCIISEGLFESVRTDVDPSKPHHSKGLLFGKGSDTTAIIGNLFIHNQDRNPVVYNNTSIVVNNLIYNANEWGVNARASTAPVKTSVLGNVVIPGINSTGYVNYAFSIATHLWSPWYNNGVGSEIYVSDNQCVNCGENPWDGVDDRGKLMNTVRVDKPPVWSTGLTPKPSSQVKAYVLANAGARPADRDSVDQRLVNDVLERTGKIINSQSEVGGWPKLALNNRKLNLPVNPHDDNDGNGYTNLEDWLHEFSAQVEGSITESPLNAPTGLQVIM
jgi:hypothetical protein